MNYPLSLSFKVLALARQLAVRDASGSLLFYVKQKALKLKEEVTVFSDLEQQSVVFKMRADRLLDFSANYTFTDAHGRTLGSIKRHGMKSLWKVHYEIADANGKVLFTIHEENPWTKVLDSLASEIPVLGMFTGYLFHPAYIVARPGGATTLRMQKQPAFFEGKFRIERQVPSAEDEERLALLGLVMMILLERRRG